MNNIQVTRSAGPNNARSESFLAIDPRNPLRMVAASKKFVDIKNYDFTIGTSYSTDGGFSWHDSAAPAMPGFTLLTDPVLAWDDLGNVFLVGLAGTNPPVFTTAGIVIYKSTDGGATWSPPKSIHRSPSDDKQWVAADTSAVSPHRGNVYAAWDNGNAGVAFARTTDHGVTWTGAAGSSAGSSIFTGSVYPEINIAPGGTIYIVTVAGDQIRMHRSADGGNTFVPTTPPAIGITPLERAMPQAGGWPILPGGSFRVITDPTACVAGPAVFVAWADAREKSSRIYYARSVDGGNTWTTGPSGRALLPTGVPARLHHFHPQIVAGPGGVVSCSLYEFGPKPAVPLIDVILARSFDGGGSFTPTTVTDRAWSPAIDAPWVHGDPAVTFIGDYMGLDSSVMGFYPLWTDTRTGIQELWTGNVSPVRDDFIAFDPAAARVIQAGGRWKIDVNGMWLLDFGSSRTEAEQALRVIRNYRLDTQCFVGRPQPSMVFYLASGQAPRGSLPGEDCIGFHPENLAVRRIDGRWKIVDGDNWLLDFAAAEDEAWLALRYLRVYGFRSICYVGRPGPSMTYFKA